MSMGTFTSERGAIVVPLAKALTTIELGQK